MLSKNEALKAMQEGHKVTREYFSSEEYIYINSMGHIMSEDGVPFENWWVNIEPTIPKTTDTPWRIYAN